MQAPAPLSHCTFAHPITIWKHAFAKDKLIKDTIVEIKLTKIHFIPPIDAEATRTRKTTFSIVQVSGFSINCSTKAWSQLWTLAIKIKCYTDPTIHNPLKMAICKENHQTLDLGLRCTVRFSIWTLSHSIMITLPRSTLSFCSVCFHMS